MFSAIANTYVSPSILPRSSAVCIAKRSAFCKGIMQVKGYILYYTLLYFTIHVIIGFDFLWAE